MSFEVYSSFVPFFQNAESQPIPLTVHYAQEKEQREVYRGRPTDHPELSDGAKDKDEHRHDGRHRQGERESSSRSDKDRNNSKSDRGRKSDDNDRPRTRASTKSDSGEQHKSPTKRSTDDKSGPPTKTTKRGSGRNDNAGSVGQGENSKTHIQGTRGRHVSPDRKQTDPKPQLDVDDDARAFCKDLGYPLEGYD